MYKELDLKDIKAKGWVKEFLETQAKGLTGEIGNVGEPFSLPTWGAPKSVQATQANAFLGGVNSLNDAWVPYEQNGYWIDGAIRAGRLTNNKKLIDIAKGKIYPEIENADKDGYIGPEFLKDGLTWAHAVYFRSYMAEYTATSDKRILDALKRHFLRRPLKESYAKKDLRIIAVRNSAEIEIALWIYGQTGDERFLTMAEESYEEFNRLFSDDSVATPNDEMLDITLDGMLGNRKVCRNHGVTYCEICKLAAILHMYTGKEVYKKAAVNAFDKLYRDQMLIDGVHSSTEYLNGNENSQAMHETCDVSDFTWALGYLYMITGDSKYGDWVENAVFNAGLGSVDDSFKGNQYFSCPNQAVCNDKSNHVVFFRGRDWHSYAPKQFLACCAGNVHRFMPNFAARSWMKDGNKLAAFVYAPVDIDVCLENGRVKISEETNYPFENTVRFKIGLSSSTEFELVLRKPSWAISAEVKLNGKTIAAKFVNGACSICREFVDGDEIQLTFTDEVEFIENAKGISVKKGALLYALPIKEKVVVEGLRELGNVDFPHYSLYAESKWNYGFSRSSKTKFVSGTFGENPWKAADNPLQIEIEANELPKWKIKRLKKYKTRFRPRDKCIWEEGDAWILPSVSKYLSSVIGKKEIITLAPYCTTRLRIAIFPEIGE